MIRSIILLAFLAVTSVCFSQHLEVEFNIRPARSSVRGNLPERFDPAWYCTSGVGLNYVLKNNTLIMFGVLYDRKGTQDKITNLADAPSSYWVRDEANFTYLTMPLQYAYRFGNKVQFQAGAGFYGSYLLKVESLRVDSNDDTQKLGGSSLVRNTDLGLTVSFAAMLPVKDRGFMKLVIDDYRGLTDVNTAGDHTMKHNSMGISFGLVLKLK